MAALQNRAGVVGLDGDTRSPAAGAVTTLASVEAIDIHSGNPVTVDDPLQVKDGTLPFFLTGQSGLVGISSVAFPFSVGFEPIGAGVSIDLFRLTLQALSPGQGILTPGGFLAGAAPIELEFIDFNIEGATINVNTVVPVPAALPLFVTALAGLGFAGYRRRKAKAA